MSKMNLLLQIYFEETNDEGLSAIKQLLAHADRADLTIFAGGSRCKLAGVNEINVPKTFNVLEGALMISNSDGSPLKSEVDIRYRPAVASTSWKKLALPVPTSIDANEEDRATFQLHLSLLGLDKSAASHDAESIAALDILCCSISALATVEGTVLDQLARLCPELLKLELWGYADVVPFRQLSIEEESQVARTGVLWADQAVTANSLHQYLLRTPNAKTRVPVPEVGVREGRLIVYKLSE